MLKNVGPAVRNVRGLRSESQPDMLKVGCDLYEFLFVKQNIHTDTNVPDE